MSDIDTAVVDSLTCLTPDGRLEKRTLGRHGPGGGPSGSCLEAWAQFPDAPAFQNQKFGLAVQRTTSRGYHFRAVYTKVSRLYPKSQVTCHHI